MVVSMHKCSVNSPPLLEMKDKIDHLGGLLRSIREAHRLSQQALSKKMYLAQGVVSRFENGGPVSESTFASYVAALEQADGLELDIDEANLLRKQVYDECYSPDRVHFQQKRLTAFHFRFLKEPPNPGYQQAVAVLRSGTYPAYIRDELWFIHAYNQPMLDLFGLTPADLKDNWAMWHVIGNKYLPGSKLAAAHGAEADIYFPRALKFFFEDTAQFFFTAQMKALRNRLWDVSKEYRRWWTSITTFNAPFGHERHPFRHILYRNDQRQERWISMDSEVEKKTIAVTAGPGQYGKYTKMRYVPRDSDTYAKEAIARLTTGEALQQVVFAADFIEDYNDWPEVKPFLAESEPSGGRHPSRTSSLEVPRNAER